MSAPDLAAMIAAVQYVTGRYDSAWSNLDGNLRAVAAVLEGLADREWLIKILMGESSWLAEWGASLVVDTLRAALLARAGGSLMTCEHNWVPDGVGSRYCEHCWTPEPEVADAPAPNLAAIIAAVRCALDDRDCNLGRDQHDAALRAAAAVLEGLSDREWLIKVLTEGPSWLAEWGAGLVVDALLTALLTRARAGQ